MLECPPITNLFSHLSEKEQDNKVERRGPWRIRPLDPEHERLACDRYGHLMNIAEPTIQSAHERARLECVSAYVIERRPTETAKEACL
jgi:hypothetical protein